LHAQTLPPVFGNEGARTDELTRKFITPRRIVWKQGNVKEQDILLKEGTGQPDIAGLPRQYSRMVTTIRRVSCSTMAVNCMAD
jgi:hypothetical protein